VLLQIGVNLRDGHADAPVAFLHFAAEDHRSQNHEGRGGHQQPGHSRAQPQHGEDDEAEHQEIAHDSNQAGREQLVEYIDIGGHARHHAAHGVAIVVGDVELLETAHELPAEIEHRFLPGPLHEPALCEVAEQAADDREQIEYRDLHQAGERVGGEPVTEERVGEAAIGNQVPVDGHLREKRAENLQDRVDQQEKKRDADGALVGAHVRQQPLHQPAVVCFA
jgi:hypothetical protein